MTKEKTTSTTSVDRVVHTPGPWKYHAGGCMVMDSDGQMAIADIRGWGTLSTRLGETVAIDRMDANGRLIADAPKMLALIRELHDFAEPMRHWEYGERARKAFRDAAILLEEHGG